MELDRQLALQEIMESQQEMREPLNQQDHELSRSDVHSLSFKLSFDSTCPGHYHADARKLALLSDSLAELGGWPSMSREAPKEVGLSSSSSSPPSPFNHFFIAVA